ncbi:MAG: Peptide deformylase [Alphaproteobacteria bacterium MarineAlpha2_Bin1]|nr:MAG: Peptide deformylase [Alphaproteobacteria bacterium MarineAlpha2_Bin1]
MSILKIAKMGHPILRKKSQEIVDPRSDSTKYLLDDMIETLEDIQGLGLAAPQVHVSKRLVIFYSPDEKSNHNDMSLSILINPIIEPLGSEIDYDWEGCLSVPGLRGLVPRYNKIRYSGFNQEGEFFDKVVDGLHARVVQHECDHLDGILYVQRMDKLENLIFESEMKFFGNT